MAHNNSTPQRVLDAPTPTRQLLWPRPFKAGRSVRIPTVFGPYTSQKVHKIRKGRKARFNK